MASSVHYPYLEHMFGAYFDQDWDSEGDDWPDLLRNYLRDSSTEEAASTADEIDRLLTEVDTEDQLEERVLSEFGCCYDAHPKADGPGFRSWLAQVADMSRAEAGA